MPLHCIGNQRLATESWRMFREALNESDFVVAQCLAHLELELIQSFLRTTSASNALRAVGLGEILIKCAHRQMAGLARDF